MLLVRDEAASIASSSYVTSTAIHWDFYFNSALSNRICYCDCTLYRHVGQILGSNREPAVRSHAKRTGKVELRHLL